MYFLKNKTRAMKRNNKISKQITRGLKAIDQLDKLTEGLSPKELQKMKRNAAKHSKGKRYNKRHLKFYIDRKTKL